MQQGQIVGIDRAETFALRVAVEPLSHSENP
jgi:hypothetical protein